MPTFTPKDINDHMTAVLMRFKASADDAAARETENPAEMQRIKAFITDALSVTDAMSGLAVKAVHALERIADTQELLVAVASADFSAAVEAEVEAQRAVLMQSATENLKRKPLGSDWPVDTSK